MTLFSWFVTSDTRRKAPIVDDITRNLYAAMRDGEPVKVPAIGVPAPGYRGMIYNTCGCGTPLIKCQGRKIKDVVGATHVVDITGIHNVACHREKLDADELAHLERLPQAVLSAKEEQMLHQLGRRYDFF